MRLTDFPRDHLFELLFVHGRRRLAFAEQTFHLLTDRGQNVADRQSFERSHTSPLCGKRPRQSWSGQAIGRADCTHRVVWVRVYGTIPKGLTVDHKCYVTLCQRPDHLRLLTRAGNTAERWERG